MICRYCLDEWIAASDSSVPIRLLARVKGSVKTRSGDRCAEAARHMYGALYAVSWRRVPWTKACMRGLNRTKGSQ